MKQIHDTLSAAQITTGSVSVATGDTNTATATIVIFVLQAVLKVIEFLKNRKKKSNETQE